MAEHLLNHNDRTVHHHPQGHYHARKTHKVYGNASELHGNKGKKQGQGNRQGNNQGGTEIA